MILNSNYCFIACSKQEVQPARYGKGPSRPNHQLSQKKENKNGKVDFYSESLHDQAEHELRAEYDLITCSLQKRGHWWFFLEIDMQGG